VFFFFIIIYFIFMPCLALLPTVADNISPLHFVVVLYLLPHRDVMASSVPAKRNEGLFDVTVRWRRTGEAGELFPVLYEVGQMIVGRTGWHSMITAGAATESTDSRLVCVHVFFFFYLFSLAQYPPPHKKKNRVVKHSFFTGCKY
jgi:hypothetical protein